MIEYDKPVHYYDSVTGTWVDQKAKKYKVEPGAVIYDNCEIGEGSIIGANAVLRPYTRIGRNTIFGTLACSEGHNEIGDNCTIHAQGHITQKVRIGNDCFIGAYFIASNTKELTKGKHGTKTEGKPELLPVVIGDRVRIGANVRVIPGITIGNDALIDQDCLITHDVFAGQHIRGGKDKVGRVFTEPDKQDIPYIRYEYP